MMMIMMVTKMRMKVVVMKMVIVVMMISRMTIERSCSTRGSQCVIVIIIII
jgi:hypothetical protein